MVGCVCGEEARRELHRTHTTRPLWCLCCLLTSGFVGVIATIDTPAHATVDGGLRDGVHGDECQEHQPRDPQRTVPHPRGGREGGGEAGEGRVGDRRSHTRSGARARRHLFPRSTAASGSRGMRGGEKAGGAGTPVVPAELAHTERCGDGAPPPRP